MKAPAEEQVQRRLTEERERLERDLGIERREPKQHGRPEERRFTISQRPHTTILHGGFTVRHDHLIAAAMTGLGYKPEPLPVPDVAAFQLGKEYGNNGQCNPTYFTVGNLVQYLQGLQAAGMSRQEIIDRYVFVTAGACGPCRFGMYEAEYRLALRNSGFEGFRVLLFQQSGSFTQAGEADGLGIDAEFFLAFFTALNLGDMLNDVGYQTRPYELEPGATDRALAQGMELLEERLGRPGGRYVEGLGSSLVDQLRKAGGTGESLAKFADALFGRQYLEALAEASQHLQTVRVDRTRVRPIVKITGEFWAQTTEGDGNYRMFSFLEGEGAEVLAEPIGTWITYLMHQAKQKIRDRKGVTEEEAIPAGWRVDRRVGAALQTRRKTAKIALGEALFLREWNRQRAALGGVPHPLTDQYELQRIAHPMYNSRAGGGEGHLEVAKNIYYSNRDLCHMVLSLKPFGCLPSTQSDGVQSAVVNRHQDMIFLPIETSGEGEINAHSRVQMALGEARAKAREELDRVLDRTGRTLDEVRAYAEEHPELQDPLHRIPHSPGTVGTAANFVLHVDGLMRRTGHRKRRLRR
jgi:predicted nucleotide-binding protein (sugar kinase/HSP70/actin superfamily)